MAAPRPVVSAVTMPCEESGSNVHGGIAGRQPSRAAGRMKPRRTGRENSRADGQLVVEALIKLAHVLGLIEPLQPWPGSRVTRAPGGRHQ